MINAKSLVAITATVISTSSFAMLCQTNMVRANGNLVNQFIGEGATEQVACREARKECSKALRLSQRRGLNPNATCELVGIVDVNIPDPTPTPTPGNNYPGSYDYELDRAEADYSRGGWRVRQAVVQDLVRTPSARAIALAVKAAGDTDRDVRAAANRTLSRLPQLMDMRFEAMNIISLVAPSLRSGSWTKRQAAADVLGKVDTAEGIIPLIGAMSDSDRDVRNAAKNSLRVLKSAYDLKQVVRRNKRDFANLIKDGTWTGRQAAVEVLGAAQVSRTIDIAVKAAGDSDNDVRSSAISAIRSITSSRSYMNIGSDMINKLGKLTRKGGWVQRQQAVFALGETRNYEARSFVIRALDDSDTDVRAAARAALNKI